MNKVESALPEGPREKSGGKEKGERAAGGERKVHWSGRYVGLLLDCVEGREGAFRNKSIHKKVWDEIGGEMAQHGFSTEHCYNKWKNLRRDVRMVALHPERGTRNEQTLARVQALLSRICPSFDPRAGSKKAAGRSPAKLSEGGSSHSLEPLGKLLTPATSPFSDLGSVGGASLGQPHYGNYSDYAATSPQPHNLFLAIEGRASRPPAAGQASSLDNSTETRSTWQYELYDLLLQFRAEEAKQAHSIAHMSRQIHEIKDCSVRRMNTIQQLINLAHVLINSKVS